MPRAASDRASTFHDPETPTTLRTMYLPALLTDSITSDLDRSIHYTLLWGLEGVVLRTVGGPSNRVPFVNESKLRRRLTENELPVVAIMPGVFEESVHDRAAWMNEVAAFEETLQFAQRIDAARVVVSAFFDEAGSVVEEAAGALRRLGQAAERRSITVVVRNEPGSAHPTGTLLARLLAAADHPSVRAAWDPAAALRSGEAPAEGLRALAGRVEIVFCSDGTGAGASWQPAPLGEGSVGWEEQAALFSACGVQGPLVLEVTVDPKPKNGLYESERLVRLARQARRASG